ncbi:MAG: class I SAM-dependent methyltransferase [Planktomarina sp.]
MRLGIALDLGLARPDGPVLVLHPPVSMDLAGLDVTIVHPMKPIHDDWASQGIRVETEVPDGRYALAVVCCTRSKAQTQDLIAQAAAVADVVVVDGQKTDGVDSHYKMLRKRCDVKGTVTKAHGRLFWFAAPDLTDLIGAPKVIGEFQTRAGVFSADGIDPASALLASALPDLKGRICDLGGGWGYLTAHVLNMAGVTQVDLVEADHVALDCAAVNIIDPRCKLHWADARSWSGTYDHVVMNPPFHTGRQGDTALGKDFITAAARSLTAKGQLWMVANRHLPYEDTLNAAFGSVTELPGDGRFKLFQASRPLA